MWHSTGLGSPGGADHWERTGGGGRNGSVRAESCRHLLSRSGNIGAAFHNIMTNGGCGMLSGDRGCVQDHMFPRFICVCILYIIFYFILEDTFVPNSERILIPKA